MRSIAEEKNQGVVELWYEDSTTCISVDMENMEDGVVYPFEDPGYFGGCAVKKDDEVTVLARPLFMGRV